jgi:hypothetical protein
VDRAQAAHGNVVVLEPTTEVFNHQDVMAYPSRRVPSRLQIQHETRENYAKVVGRHAAANRTTREEVPHWGEIWKRLFFHRFRHPSSCPSRPQNTNSKSIRRNSRRPTLA